MLILVEAVEVELELYGALAACVGTIKTCECNTRHVIGIQVSICTFTQKLEF